MPLTDVEIDATDDALDHPDDSLDPDEAEAPLRPVAAAATEVTTARATLDLGDLGSWISGIQIRPLDGGRVALELPRSAALALGGLLRALATAVARDITKHLSSKRPVRRLRRVDIFAPANSWPKLDKMTRTARWEAQRQGRRRSPHFELPRDKDADF